MLWADNWDLNRKEVNNNNNNNTQGSVYGDVQFFLRHINTLTYLLSS